MKYVVYTVGGWYKASGHNEQTMFSTDADRITLKKAKQIVEEKELWESDIAEATAERVNCNHERTVYRTP